jgi:hypothetical protein
MEYEKPSSKEIAASSISRLRRARDDWKDGMPPEKKHSTSEDPHWKIRKAWFQAVGGEFELLQVAVAQGNLSISADLNEKITSINTLIFNEIPLRDPREEDINKVSAVVEDALKELEQS